MGYTQIELVCTTCCPTTSNSEVFAVVPSRTTGRQETGDLSWKTFIVLVCMKSDRNSCIIKKCFLKTGLLSHVHTAGQSYRNDRTRPDLNRHQTSSSDGLYWFKEQWKLLIHLWIIVVCCSNTIQYILFTNLHILMCIEHFTKNNEY